MARRMTIRSSPDSEGPWNEVRNLDWAPQNHDASGPSLSAGVHTAPHHATAVAAERRTSAKALGRADADELEPTRWKED